MPDPGGSMGFLGSSLNHPQEIRSLCPDRRSGDHSDGAEDSMAVGEIGLLAKRGPPTPKTRKQSGKAPLTSNKFRSEFFLMQDFIPSAVQVSGHIQQLGRSEVSAKLNI